MSWYYKQWSEEELAVAKSLLKKGLYLFKDGLQQAYIVYDTPPEKDGLTAYTIKNQVAWSYKLEGIKMFLDYET